MFGFGRSKTELLEGFEREAVPLMADVFRIARWLTRDITEAEDLTQETFTQAFRSFHGYEAGTNCKAWLVRILYNVNARRLKRLARLHVVEDPDDKFAESIVFEPSVAGSLTEQEVLNALKKVPKQYSQVVVLADVEDFSYREIAEVMGVPIGTVMSRLHRGRKMLRIELAEYARDFGFGVRKLG